MAWTNAKQGSTLTDGTEQTLYDSIAGADTPVNATFQVSINERVLQAGDQVTVRIYRKIPGDTNLDVVYAQPFAGVQSADDRIKLSPAIGSTNGLKVTIKRDLGTDRTHLWVVETI